ncbi:MAG: putative lipid II flippase FtsW [Planctomycetaceae bacterium]|nr:putative lipid II flippase FtsW [Planctomycetaceae bacterium]
MIGSTIHYSRMIETVVIVLMAMGTVFVFSAGATVSGEYKLTEFYNFTTLKQLVFFPLAVVIMYAVANVNYRRYSICDRPPGYSVTPYLYAVTVILLAVTLVWGVERNESRRWLDLAPGGVYISFQPSELAKWVLVIFLAALLEKYADSMGKFWTRFLPMCLFAGLVVGLIVIEDFGTAAFIAMMTFILLLIGGAKLWHLLLPLPIVLGVFVLAIITSDYRRQRIASFLDPNDVPYQAQQSLIAISTGGVFGKGLGHGVIKYGHLPEDTTDFIFSIIAEETGFFVCVFVILLFFVFAAAGTGVVLQCRDKLGRLLAAGIVMAISLQAAVNLGVVTVVLPTKGIPLPFISAGGTSMLLTSAAIGVLLNIARHGAERDPGEEELPVSRHSRTFKS